MLGACKLETKMGMKARKELNERNLSKPIEANKSTTRDLN
jgi:hypothetical protein